MGGGKATGATAAAVATASGKGCQAASGKGRVGGRLARAQAKLATVHRRQARRVAKSGLWLELITEGRQFPRYGHGKRRRY